MSFPTPYRVGWHVRSVGGADRYRDVITYTPAKGQVGTQVSVIGWAAPQSGGASRDGSYQVGHDRIIVDVELFALPAFRPGRGDLIDLPGDGQYEVSGPVQDWNHGFHQWRPGNVIPLQRVEG